MPPALKPGYLLFLPNPYLKFDSLTQILIKHHVTHTNKLHYCRIVVNLKLLSAGAYIRIYFRPVMFYESLPALLSNNYKWPMVQTVLLKYILKTNGYLTFNIQTKLLGWSV
jgi:hypothetical protein